MPSPSPQSTREKWQSIHGNCLEAAEQASIDPEKAHLVQSFTTTAAIALDKLMQIDKVGPPFLASRTDIP